MDERMVRGRYWLRGLFMVMEFIIVLHYTSPDTMKPQAKHS